MGLILDDILFWRYAFRHKNVIEYDDRPFSSVDEMDKVLIENWNKKVNDEEHVYIIGDLSYAID